MNMKNQNGFMRMLKYDLYYLLIMFLQSAGMVVLLYFFYKLLNLTITLAAMSLFFLVLMGMILGIQRYTFFLRTPWALASPEPISLNRGWWYALSTSQSAMAST